MNILENELIRKYFGWSMGPTSVELDDMRIAYFVLAAMQEPIKKGDRYLSIDQYGNVTESSQSSETGWADYHPSALRLPQRFQTPEKKECDHPFKNLVFQTSGILCCLCSKRVKSSCAEKPADDRVENQIREILENTKYYQANFNEYSDALRELVALVRSTDQDYQSVPGREPRSTKEKLK